MSINRKVHPLRSLRKKPVLKYAVGPLLFITARFNHRHTVFILLLCLPALLMTALLTLPGMLFNSPKQNEYFHFAQILNETPERWWAMGLSACCCLFCFAVPSDIHGLIDESAE